MCKCILFWKKNPTVKNVLSIPNRVPLWQKITGSLLTLMLLCASGEATHKQTQLCCWHLKISQRAVSPSTKHKHTFTILYLYGVRHSEAFQRDVTHTVSTQKQTDSHMPLLLCVWERATDTSNVFVVARRMQVLLWDRLPGQQSQQHVKAL